MIGERHPSSHPGLYHRDRGCGDDSGPGPRHWHLAPAGPLRKKACEVPQGRSWEGRGRAAIASSMMRCKTRSIALGDGYEIRFSLYLAGLIVPNAVALEFQAWSEFERAWQGRPNKPPFGTDFATDAIVLALAAMLNFVGGIFAFHKIYGGSGFSGWENSVWSVFVQWLCLTFLVVPVALVAPLVAPLMAPVVGPGVPKSAFLKYGLGVTLVTAI